MDNQNQSQVALTKSTIASLGSNNLTTLHNIERVVTIIHSIEHGAMISKMVAKMGERDVAKALFGILAMSLKVFNVTMPLNDDQLYIITYDILEKYKHENIEDIVLAMRDARTKPQKLYSKIDATDIYGWIDEYLDKKIEAREEAHRKRKGEFAEQQRDGVPMPDWFAERIRTIGKNNKPKEVTKHTPSYDNLTTTALVYLNEFTGKQLQDIKRDMVKAGVPENHIAVVKVSERLKLLNKPTDD